MILRRQARYKQLTAMGCFLPFECKELSKIPFKIPYYQVLRHDRQRWHNQFATEGIEKGLPKAEIARLFAIEVLAEYGTHGWKRNGKYDIYAMLRHYEHTHRAKFPQYESPWEESKRKSRTSSDFMAKVERTYANQAERDQRRQEQRRYGYGGA